MAPGRGPAPLGRRPKNINGETLNLGDEVIRSDNPPRFTTRRPHNFSHVVDHNLPGARFQIEEINFDYVKSTYILVNAGKIEETSQS